MNLPEICVHSSYVYHSEMLSDKNLLMINSKRTALQVQDAWRNRSILLPKAQPDSDKIQDCKQAMQLHEVARYNTPILLACRCTRVHSETPAEGKR